MENAFDSGKLLIGTLMDVIQPVVEAIVEIESQRKSIIAVFVTFGPSGFRRS